jgi:hypothetical protein
MSAKFIIHLKVQEHFKHSRTSSTSLVFFRREDTKNQKSVLLPKLPKAINVSFDYLPKKIKFHNFFPLSSFLIDNQVQLISHHYIFNILSFTRGVPRSSVKKSGPTCHLSIPGAKYLPPFLRLNYSADQYFCCKAKQSALSLQTCPVSIAQSIISVEANVLAVKTESIFSEFHFFSI